jgi:hypothetical protein
MKTVGTFEVKPDKCNVDRICMKIIISSQKEKNGDNKNNKNSL